MLPSDLSVAPLEHLRCLGHVVGGSIRPCRPPRTVWRKRPRDSSLRRGITGPPFGHLAGALGLHKSSVYTHIDGKEHLLAQIALAGSRSFHDGLDALPSAASPAEKLRLALRTHLRTVASQIGVAVIWLHEWRHLTGEAREEFLTHRRIYEHRIRRLFEEAVRAGDLVPDLDVKRATLIYLSVANWA